MTDNKQDSNLLVTTMDAIQLAPEQKAGYKQSKLWQNKPMSIHHRVSFPSPAKFLQTTFAVKYGHGSFVDYLPSEIKGMYQFYKYKYRHIFKIVAPYNCNGKYVITWSPYVTKNFPINELQKQPWFGVPENTFSCDITNDSTIEFDIPYMATTPSLWVNDRDHNSHFITGRPLVGPHYGPGEKEFQILHRVQFVEVEVGGYLFGKPWTQE